MVVVEAIVAIFIWIILILWKTAIFWVPFILGKAAFFLWHHFVVERFIGGIEWAVLEIQLPRVMTKTPLAMELFITNALYHMSQKGGWETYWQGAVHFWYSLEIASIDGQVHFFIRVPSRIKKLVETQLYAQFPQVRVFEVPDYTESLPKFKNDGPYYMWGCEFKFKKHDAYSLKTYKDFGLDKASDKEEMKIDPMSGVLEFLGALDRGEQLWIQIIIRQSEKTYHTHGTLFKHHDFYEEADVFFDELLLPFSKDSISQVKGDVRLEQKVPAKLDSEVKSGYNKMSKLVFDTGIRMVVIGDKSKVSIDTFNNTRRASRLLFRQYGDMSSNSLERYNSTQFDETWADPYGKRLEKKKHYMITYYKLRTLFYPFLLRRNEFTSILNRFFVAQTPEYNVLSTEEIATIYHFPGMVSETPTFTRVESKTAKPPANLPM
jgi:hypothetical protein